VVFAGRDVSFADMIGLTGAVSAIDASLFKKEVLK
jgi:hypothetical protein